MTHPDGPSAVAPAMASGEATESATPISARVTSSAAAPRRVRTQLLDTEVQLSIVEGRIARRQDTVTELLRRRNVVGWLLAGVILGLTEYLLYFFHVLTGDTLVIVPTISLVLFIVAPLATVGEQQTFISRFQLERQELLEKKQILESFLAAGLDVPTTPSTDSAPSPKESYFDRIVAINLDNLSKYLTAYYNLVQLHTEKSFNASRIAGGMGFALILVGIIVGYVKRRAATHHLHRD